MRETIASVKRELEKVSGDRYKAEQDVRWHERQLEKIGSLLNEALYPNPMGLNTIGSIDKADYTVGGVMALAAKVAERIRGLKEILSITQSNHADLLDRFAPHKPDPRTTAADDGVASLRGR